MKEESKNLLLFLFKLMILLFIFSIVLLAVIFAIPSQYKTYFNSALPAKIERLEKAESPKIILAAGSSMFFGIDSKLLEEKTGMPVVNMGLHAGLGAKFSLEMIRDSVGGGDIIVYAPEYWNDSGMQAELALISSQDKYEVIKRLPKEVHKSIAMTYPTYIRKKLVRLVLHQDTFDITTDNEYSAKYTNEYLESGYLREKNNIMEDNVAKETTLLDTKGIENGLINYTNDYWKFAQDKGAHIIISFPPMNKTSIVYDQKQIDEFIEQLDIQLMPQIVSNPKDYIFSHDMFFGTNFHLNDKGVKLRTLQLSKDINSFIDSNIET